MNNNYNFNPTTGEFDNNPRNETKTNNAFNDKGIGLWGIPFLLFPYIGLIVYYFIKKKKPKKAKSILNWSIVGGVLLFLGLFN